MAAPDLYEVPSLLLCTALLVLLLASIEAGHATGRRVREDDWEASSSAFLTLASAAMALLGLLLAFSFSMAVARFEARQAVILKEANIIGTTYLRADFLQPELAAQLKSALRGFTDERIAYHLTLHDSPERQASMSRAQAIQAQLWMTVTPVENYQEPKAMRLSLLVASVNDLIDVTAERQFVLDNRVPQAVIWMVFAVTLVAGAMGGFAFGAKRQRNWLAVAGFALMISIVVYTILDLDRPRRGLIQVDQKPMLDLKASLRSS